MYMLRVQVVKIKFIKFTGTEPATNWQNHMCNNSYGCLFMPKIYIFAFLRAFCIFIRLLWYFYLPVAHQSMSLMSIKTLKKWSIGYFAWVLWPPYGSPLTAAVVKVSAWYIFGPVMCDSSLFMAVWSSISIIFQSK